MSRLPCLRYKITDSTLYRTGLPDSMPFYRKHPMAGPSYGDFYMYEDVKWTGAPPRFLSLGQLGGKLATKNGTAVHDQKLTL